MNHGEVRLRVPSGARVRIYVHVTPDEFNDAIDTIGGELYCRDVVTSSSGRHLVADLSGPPGPTPVEVCVIAPLAPLDPHPTTHPIPHQEVGP